MVYYPTSVEWKIQWKIVPETKKLETCFSDHTYWPRNIFASPDTPQILLTMYVKPFCKKRAQTPRRTLFNSQPPVIHSATMALYEISSVDSLIINEFLKTGFLNNSARESIFLSICFFGRISLILPILAWKYSYKCSKRYGV